MGSVWAPRYENTKRAKKKERAKLTAGNRKCSQTFYINTNFVPLTEFCNAIDRNDFMSLVKTLSDKLFLNPFPIDYNSAEVQFLEAEIFHAMCLPEDTFLIDFESRLKQVFGLSNLAISHKESKAKYVLFTEKKIKRDMCQYIHI